MGRRARAWLSWEGFPGGPNLRVHPNREACSGERAGKPLPAPFSRIGIGVITEGGLGVWVRAIVRRRGTSLEGAGRNRSQRYLETPVMAPAG